MVIVLSLIVGVTDAISMPSFQSIVPSIVERHQIGSALALSSTQFNLSRILGPEVAGAVMTAVGAIGCFALNKASYIPFIGVALWVLPRRGITVAARDRSDRRQLLAGVRAAARDPMLRGALVTVLVSSVLCRPLVIFCPLLVKAVFHREISSFSLAVTSFGVGGLTGAVALLGINSERDRRPRSSYLAVAYAATLVLVALDPWFWGLPLLFVLAGFAMTASNTSTNTLLQAMAPDRSRGQTVSLIHARVAWRDFLRRAFDRCLYSPSMGAASAVYQRGAGRCAAGHHRKVMGVFIAACLGPPVAAESAILTTPSAPLNL